MAAAEPVRRENPAVSKALQDRVEADAETVEHVLNPARTPENVRYPDPNIPNAASGAAPDSMAEAEMARRTDAGPFEPQDQPSGSNMTPWIIGAVLVVLVIAAIAWMA